MAAWQKTHSSSFNGEHTGKYVLGPAVENGMISAEFTCKPERNLRMFILDQTFGIGLIDYSPREREGVLVISATMTNGEFMGIRSPEFGTVFVPRSYTVKAKHRVTVIGVGDRVNVVVDNRTVFDGPLKPVHSDRRLLGCIWRDSMEATLTGLEWRRLDVPVATTAPGER